MSKKSGNWIWSVSWRNGLNCFSGVEQQDWAATPCIDAQSFPSLCQRRSLWRDLRCFIYFSWLYFFLTQTLTFQIMSMSLVFTYQISIRNQVSPSGWLPVEKERGRFKSPHQPISQPQARSTPPKTYQPHTLQAHTQTQTHSKKEALWDEERDSC